MNYIWNLSRLLHFVFALLAHDMVHINKETILDLDFVCITFFLCRPLCVSICWYLVLCREIFWSTFWNDTRAVVENNEQNCSCIRVRANFYCDICHKHEQNLGEGYVCFKSSDFPEDANSKGSIAYSRSLNLSSIQVCFFRHNHILVYAILDVENN